MAPRQSYAKIGDSDATSETEDTVENWPKNYDARRPWILSTLILSLLLCSSLASHLFRYDNYRDRWRDASTMNNSYEKGFDTDLRAIRDEIETIPYEYIGGIQLSVNGTYKSVESKYVGKPNSRMDKEWHALLLGLNMDLPRDEAEELNEETYNWKDTDLYFTGLGVFHSLHCLNRIRQAFYPDYYHIWENPRQPPRQMHLDHCIDYLRQSIQCHSDLTPMLWNLTTVVDPETSEEGQKLILTADGQHTCRDFGRIREWAVERKVDWSKHVGGERIEIID